MLSAMISTIRTMRLFSRGGGRGFRYDEGCDKGVRFIGGGERVESAAAARHGGGDGR